MWKRFREHFGNKIGAAGWLWVLFHLVMIKVQGTVRIWEPNDWILYIEYGIVIFVLYVFIHNSIDDWKENK